MDWLTACGWYWSIEDILVLACLLYDICYFKGNFFVPSYYDSFLTQRKLVYLDRNFELNVRLSHVKVKGRKNAF